MRPTVREAEKYQKARRARSRWRSVFACLAAVVLLGTIYWQMRPAITLTPQTAYCGVEAHTHEDECYQDVLMCTLSTEPVEPEPSYELVSHEHTDACWGQTEICICDKPETEDAFHEHSDECYDEDGVLICQTPEYVEGHTHGEDCFDTDWALTCGLEAGELELVELEADEEPAPAHVHTQGCYERVLVCTREEHTHTLACYSDASADLETAADWEATLPALTQEDVGERVAAVAVSQLGYTQSERNYEVDSAGGKHGYTRYGAWYGYPYSDWCAMFASFCLHYAGVEQSQMPYASGCIYWGEQLQSRELYQAADAYTPQMGDLVFFDKNYDGLSDHVGVVTDVTDGEIESAEGNLGGAVTLARHAADAADICGYGLLPREEAAQPTEDGQGGMTSSAPTEETPTEGELTEDTPTEETPAEEAPADETPADGQTPEEAPEDEAAKYICGMQEHEHDERCYSAKGELTCELPAHRHTDECCPAPEEDDSEAGEDEAEEEWLCGMQAHLHNESCFDEGGALVCGLSAHTHTESCLLPQASSLSEEELREIEAQFTQEVEALEALEELTDEEILQAEDLLTRLTDAHSAMELSDEAYTALYARVSALLTQEYDAIAEACEGTNWLLLRDSGWFEAYSAPMTASYSLYAADDEAGVAPQGMGEDHIDENPSSKQVKEKGGSKSDDEDEVSISKTITGTELENVFDITLQVETPQKIEEVIQEPDMAVVIVMDISNTMNDNFGGVTRYAAAMEAAEDFLDKFAEENTLGISKVGYVAFNTDAHQIFSLQSCTNETQANALKNTMRTATGSIINANGYGVAHNRFTNIEGGLKMAQDMLSGVSNQNKFIILLTDGFPTTYLESGYKGYDPYDTTGRFYDHVLNVPCSSGTSYSDEAAIRARNMAASIRNSGTTIFSIGVDVGGQTIQKYIDSSEKLAKNEKPISIVDRTGTTYEIGSATSTEAYKNWLKTSIGSGYYYDSTNTEGLKNAYTKIFEQIKTNVETGAKADWVTTDAIPTFTEGGVVEFISFFDKNENLCFESLTGEHKEGGENTASYATNKDGNGEIYWDLKESGYTSSTKGGKMIYAYSLKYRVRLKNEQKDYEENAVRPTNEVATLTYRVIRTVNGSYVKSEQKELDFPIPSVEGYLGELEFTKKDSRGNPLQGAEFTLHHDDSCGFCRGDKATMVTITDMTDTADENGKVTFAKIPSGHTYTLTETKVPAGYATNGNYYTVTVAYDKVTVTVTGANQQDEVKWDGEIINNAYYELPSTGGIGTALYALGGSGLMLAALGGLRRRRRGGKK